MVSSADRRCRRAGRREREREGSWGKINLKWPQGKVEGERPLALGYLRFLQQQQQHEILHTAAASNGPDNFQAEQLLLLLLSRLLLSRLLLLLLWFSL